MKKSLRTTLAVALLALFASLPSYASQDGTNPRPQNPHDVSQDGTNPRPQNPHVLLVAR